MDAEGLIKRHEGLRLNPYRCTAGKLTIGYGRNLEARGITQSEAEFLLRNDIRHTVDGLEHELKKRKPAILEVELGCNRTGALVDMAFNLGIAGIMEFKKMWAAIEKKDWEEAAKEMLDSKWAEQVGRRAIEDAEIMRTGEWK